MSIEGESQPFAGVKPDTSPRPYNESGQPFSEKNRGKKVFDDEQRSGGRERTRLKKNRGKDTPDELGMSQEELDEMRRRETGDSFEVQHSADQHLVAPVEGKAPQRLPGEGGVGDLPDAHETNGEPPASLTEQERRIQELQGRINAARRGAEVRSGDRDNIQTLSEQLADLKREDSSKFTPSSTTSEAEGPPVPKVEAPEPVREAVPAVESVSDNVNSEPSDDPSSRLNTAEDTVPPDADEPLGPAAPTAETPEPVATPTEVQPTTRAVVAVATEPVSEPPLQRTPPSNGRLSDLAAEAVARDSDQLRGSDRGVLAEAYQRADRARAATEAEASGAAAPPHSEFATKLPSGRVEPSPTVVPEPTRVPQDNEEILAPSVPPEPSQGESPEPQLSAQTRARIILSQAREGDSISKLSEEAILRRAEEISGQRFQSLERSPKPKAPEVPSPLEPPTEVATREPENKSTTTKEERERKALLKEYEKMLEDAKKDPFVYGREVKGVKFKTEAEQFDYFQKFARLYTYTFEGKIDPTKDFTQQWAIYLSKLGELESIEDRFDAVRALEGMKQGFYRHDKSRLDNEIDGITLLQQKIIESVVGKRNKAILGLFGEAITSRERAMGQKEFDYLHVKGLFENGDKLGKKGEARLQEVLKQNLTGARIKEIVERAKKREASPNPENDGEGLGHLNQEQQEVLLGFLEQMAKGGKATKLDLNSLKEIAKNLFDSSGLAEKGLKYSDLEKLVGARGVWMSRARRAALIGLIILLFPALAGLLGMATQRQH